MIEQEFTYAESHNDVSGTKEAHCSTSVHYKQGQSYDSVSGGDVDIYLLFWKPSRFGQFFSCLRTQKKTV